MKLLQAYGVLIAFSSLAAWFFSMQSGVAPLALLGMAVFMIATVVE